MHAHDSLISQFISCDNTKEAIEITESCHSSDAFLALVDLNGSYYRVSDSAKRLIGCDLDNLESETIFSMTSDSDRSNLFKACSTTVLEGAVYRISQHIRCAEWNEVPVVTHMKKVTGSAGRDMILCMNVKA